MSEISIGEWQAELARYSQGDDGLTVSEIGAKLGLSQSRAKAIVAKALASGRCVKGVGHRVDSGGKTYWAAVYRLGATVALDKKQRADRFAERSAK